jgi:hypothetical protein
MKIVDLQKWKEKRETRFRVDLLTDHERGEILRLWELQRERGWH